MDIGKFNQKIGKLKRPQEFIEFCNSWLRNEKRIGMNYGEKTLQILEQVMFIGYSINDELNKPVVVDEPDTLSIELEKAFDKLANPSIDNGEVTIIGTPKKKKRRRRKGNV